MPHALLDWKCFPRGNPSWPAMSRSPHRCSIPSGAANNSSSSSARARARVAGRELASDDQTVIKFILCDQTEPRMRRHTFKAAADDDSLPVIIPRNDKAVVPISPERVRRLRKHLVLTLRALRTMKGPEHSVSPLKVHKAALDPEAAWGKFARDSPLAGDGFVPSVPLGTGGIHSSPGLPTHTSSEFPPGAIVEKPGFPGGVRGGAGSAVGKVIREFICQIRESPRWRPFHCGVKPVIRALAHDEQGAGEDELHPCGAGVDRGIHWPRDVDVNSVARG